MKSSTRLITIIGLIGLGFMMPLNMASAHSDFLQRLSAEWWQWALSIPVSENPILDTTGEKCIIGQRGSTWFLAGNAGGETTRTCSVPEGTVLFFPVINSVNIDTPDVCGQGPERIPVEDLRATSATFIDGASNLVAEVDGEPIDNLRRVQSKVFVVALPEENLFVAPCAALGGAPAGIYSPAVDDGFYVKLEPLEVGDHTLHFHAENLGADFVLDVTYNLTVVPIVRTGDVTFTDAEGTIKVFVCSRGCFQYLLETGGKLYFPDAVPDDLKTDGQRVIFTGTLLPDTTIVTKPGPDDNPVPDFEAQNIHIIKMVSK